MKKLILLTLILLAGASTLNAQVTLAYDIVTGDDDLRGGNDNVNLIVIMNNGYQIRLNNANSGARWANNSTNQVTQIISTGSMSDILAFRLETTFGGGMGGDNWNLNRLTINAIVSGVTTKLFDSSGNPLFRFTGDQKGKDFKRLPLSVTTPPTSATTTGTPSAPAVMTKFNPSIHGFKFINSFKNIFISGVDWITSGLCGGMSYAALDYFKYNKRIPQQIYIPAEGMPLRQYLYDRQMTSMMTNIDRWAEFGLTNVFGARNTEFFNWGLQTGSGQLGRLMSYIDRGEPVVLGLSSCGDGCKGDHQVLAIGYKLGRYNGDLGPYVEDLIIYVCDPNYPEVISELKPNKAGSYFSYPDKKDNPRWRTYFVNTKYTPQLPPDIPLNPKEVIFSFKTGGDDLRGGKDNVNLTIVTNIPDPSIKLPYGQIAYKSFTWNNVNNGSRWVNDSYQQISKPLDNNVDFSKANIQEIYIETTFSGGDGGDNWNLNEIYVSTRINGKTEVIIAKEGTPFFRFTGDSKLLRLKVSSPSGQQVNVNAVSGQQVNNNAQSVQQVNVKEQSVEKVNVKEQSVQKIKR